MAFRDYERKTLSKILAGADGVIALGGGALLDKQNRTMVENAGQVLCLTAPVEVLWGRIQRSKIIRPLLTDQYAKNNPSNSRANQDKHSDHDYLRLQSLIQQRADHYASFENQLDTSSGSMDVLTWEAQIQLGAYRVTGMGRPYSIRIVNSGRRRIGQLMMELGINGSVGLVCDTNVAALYSAAVIQSLETSGFPTHLIVIPPGEENKNISILQKMWSEFLAAGLERGSTLVALGGGVVGDLTGFAAATYLRGIRWVAVPTTLLAMVDASLGGKTGADMPQGKNLIGAFYPPDLVLADPEVLGTLPDLEMRSGLAEVVKHGILGDPALFEICEQGWSNVNLHLSEIVSRAMAVKVKVVSEDPYEQGKRAILNLGHTLGHAIERASDYSLRHGECVAIGMVAATKVSIKHGYAKPELQTRIERTLTGLGLPVGIPQYLHRESILSGIKVDKKKKAGKVRLVLPVDIGDVRIDFAIDRVEELFE